MKLIGYQISGQTVGVDINQWSVNDLNGNEPFSIINDSDAVTSGYTDISSITSWGYWGEEIDPKLTHMDIRNEIKVLLTPAQLSGNSSGLTSEEILVIEEFKLDKYYSLYDYFNTLPNDINVENPPVDLNYNILGLHKKREFNKGELGNVEYYGEYDFTNNVYSNLILHENRTYYRINGMVYLRDMNICWHYNDFTSGGTKNTTKYYTQEESIRVGERRRENVISTLKIEVIGLIMITSGKTQQEAEGLGFLFLTDYSVEIDIYISGVESLLKDVFTDDTNHDWLNNEIPNAGGLTIRQYLHDSISIDYTINNTNT